MLKVKRRFRRFRLDDEAQILLYNELLNNPLCTVTEKILEKEKITHYNDENGHKINEVDHLYYLVHWEEKEI